MGVKPVGNRSRTYGTAWAPAALLITAAISCTLLIAANANAHIIQNQREFTSQQRVRLQDIEVRVDDYFGKAIQLCAAAAQILAPLQQRPKELDRLTAHLFQSRSTQQISGVGAFYARGAFLPGRAYAVYDETGTANLPRRRIISSASAAYARSFWYARAKAVPPYETAFAGPYTSNAQSVISTLRAMRRGREFVGVVAVDTPSATFLKENMTRPIVAGDIAWIESSNKGRALLATGPLPDKRNRLDSVLRLRYTGAYIHLSTDERALHDANARVILTSAIVAGAIWLFAGVIGYAFVQVRASRARAQSLEVETSRLEHEVAVQRRVEAELRKAAFTDELTGLPNRAAFMERAESAISERTPNGSAVFFVDLDRFNMVNETLGHSAGDDLLKSIAKRLRDLAPEGWVARLGGDEFVVLARCLPGEVPSIADRILSTLRKPSKILDRVVYTDGSIGIVVADERYGNPEDLLRDADIAMYEAKRRGRGRYVLFDAAMRRQIEAESDLENDLRRAIEQREFVPYYQPVVDIRSLGVVSFEALARWPRNGTRVLDAAGFVAFAERRGLVGAIDDCIFDRVCRDAASLLQRFPNSTIAVNISAVHLTAPDLAVTLYEIADRHGVNPQCLCLEITETAVMLNTAQALVTLEALRRNGIQIVLDDFGSGQSSLAYLHRLPVAVLKIDRSFISSLPRDEHAVAIVRGIVALAESLDLHTIAEGIETHDQLEILRQAGVTRGQGFLFSRALSLDEALRLPAHIGTTQQGAGEPHDDDVRA